MRIVAIGEVLWDVIGGHEYLGGAALNFSAHAARLGHEVFFVSAVGNDERGHRVLDHMRKLGLTTRYVREIPTHPTGIVTVELDSVGAPRFTLHHPAAYDAPELAGRDLAELLSPQPDWIYFGTLFQMSPQARHLTYRLLDFAKSARRFYDVNLRKDSYTPALVQELLARGQVVKLNAEEVEAINQMLSRPRQSAEDFCRSYAQEFGWRAVCVTRGEAGCSMLVKGNYCEAAGYAIKTADSVGADDAFAAAAVHGLSLNWQPEVIADFANRVAAMVASRQGGTPPWTMEEVQMLRH